MITRRLGDICTSIIYSNSWKTIGKPLENGGLMGFYSDSMGFI